MSLWMGFLMAPGYRPQPLNTSDGWLGAALGAFSALQTFLIGQMLSD